MLETLVRIRHEFNDQLDLYGVVSSYDCTTLTSRWFAKVCSRVMQTTYSQTSRRVGVLPEVGNVMCLSQLDWLGYNSL